MEIVKVYRERLPQVKLAGRRFTDRDRDGAGTFAVWWKRAFEEKWFEPLMKCKGVPGVGPDCLGAMRPKGRDGEFEYWIGMFLAPDAEVPDGFEAEEIAAGDLGVCWLRGDEKSGELVGVEASDAAMAAMTGQGWAFAPGGWFVERYNCPRYTQPDEKGHVILDICAYLV